MAIGFLESDVYLLIEQVLGHHPVPRRRGKNNGKEMIDFPLIEPTILRVSIKLLFKR
ncbi:MAG: hypothetical protein HN368_24275 [Spirochaetales bacterium]|nr:hypothetical protein [Spirochaetales bacterium]